MNIRSRHLGMLTYAGCVSLAIVIKPDLLQTMTDLVLVTAPLIVLATVDKIEAVARNVSGINSK